MPNQEAGLNHDHGMCRAVLHANPGSAARSPPASAAIAATNIASTPPRVRSNRHLKEIGNIQQTENLSEECRNKSALVVENPRMRKPKRRALRFQLAATARQNILNPLRLATISQGDYHLLSATEDYHRSPVLPPAFATGVYDYPHTRQTSGNRGEQPIGKAEINSCEPAGRWH
jgi:hypothetical protein